MEKVLVRVDKEWKDKVGSIHIGIADDKRFKNMKGEVVAVPKLGNYVVRGIDVGQPPPRPYYSADMQSTKLRLGWDSNNTNMYCPTLYDPEYIHERDIPVEIKVGDTVYFAPTVTHPDNTIYEDVYAIRYSELICNQEKMLSGWVLIDMMYDEGVEDIDVDGKTIKGKISHGIVTEVNSKPILTEGRVEKVPTPFKDDALAFGVGQHVLFRKNRDWIVNIEGKEYYVVRYWDIIATL